MKILEIVVSLFVIIVLPVMFLVGLYKLASKLINRPREPKTSKGTVSFEKSRERIAHVESEIEALKHAKEKTAKVMPSEMRIEKFCPACGAPVDLNNSKCAYCDTILPGISARLQRQKEIENEKEKEKEMKVLEHRHEEKMQAIKRGNKIEKTNRSHAFIALLAMFFLFVIIAKIISR